MSDLQSIPATAAVSGEPGPTDGHPRRRQVLAVLCLSLLIVVVDNTILNTALPTLARDLRASTTELQWIVDAYTLVLVWSAMAGVGIVVGPTLGGVLLKHYSWASVFWVGVPPVAIALVLVLLVVPVQPALRAPGSRLDTLGALLSAASMVALVDALIEAPSRGWTGAVTVAELGAAVLLLVAFVGWELRVAHPLIDVRVFRHPTFSASVTAVGLIFFSLFGALFALTQYLQVVKDFSALQAGMGAMPFAAAVLVFSPVGAVAAVRLGVRVVIPAGLAAMGSGLLLLSQAEPSTAYVALAGAVAVMGAGMALVLAPAGEAMMSVLPAEQAGVGSAVNDTLQELGGTLGVAVVGSVVAASYRSALDASLLPDALLSPARDSIAAAEATAASAGALGARLDLVANAAFTHAMSTGLTVAALAALVGAVIVALFLPKRQPNPIASPQAGVPADLPATTPTLPVQRIDAASTVGTVVSTFPPLSISGLTAGPTWQLCTPDS